MVFKRFTEIKAEFFGFFNYFFVDIENEIVLIPQVYLHPRARIGNFYVKNLVL